MLQQPDELRTPPAVRNGQVTVVTCAACGCRLQPSAVEDGIWRHFGALGGRDARSHRTGCVEFPHDAFGRALIPA
jgi:hypothetical protein